VRHPVDTAVGLAWLGPQSDFLLGSEWVVFVFWARPVTDVGRWVDAPQLLDAGCGGDGPRNRTGTRCSPAKTSRPGLGTVAQKEAPLAHAAKDWKKESIIRPYIRVPWGIPVTDELNMAARPPKLTIF
jgi:hypothetical protein